jgi:hypothetical protein
MSEKHEMSSASSTRSIGGNDIDATQSECSQETSSEVKNKKHKLLGGCDCAFIEELPKYLQTVCSICLCVLKDPYLVDCCGISFCQSCIKPVKDNGKPCPVCNVNFITCIPDKRLQRTLNGMKVYCSNKGLGCEWTGKLGSLSLHLNTETKISDQEVSCMFTSLECAFCGKDFLRKDLGDHKSNKCPKRSYSCDYCNGYESTCEDVTTNHWPVCPSCPVPCPNQCGVYPERRNLDFHVDKECPLTVIDCSLRYAGCTEKLQRKDMHDHFASNLPMHMSLQAISHQQAMQSLKFENSELKKLIQGLERKLKEQETSFDARFTQLQEEKLALEEKLKAWQEFNIFLARMVVDHFIKNTRS